MYIVCLFTLLVLSFFWNDRWFLIWAVQMYHALWKCALGPDADSEGSAQGTKAILLELAPVSSD